MHNKRILLLNNLKLSNGCIRNHMCSEKVKLLQDLLLWQTWVGIFNELSVLFLKWDCCVKTSFDFMKKTRNIMGFFCFKVLRIQLDLNVC